MPVLPTPALVTQRAAQRLPRPALLLLVAAYVLPGVFGRDPWRNADLTAFGYMLDIAEGRTSWLAPTLGGWPAETALLPHWLGASFIWLLQPWVEPALAARLPFAALLAGTLSLVWYACYNLARTESAQPVAFAFGGEANPVDYARALADGALLATISTLGLLQLGHETTPELVQLFEVALFIWALAAAPYQKRSVQLGSVLSLVGLAGSGGPFMALLFGSLALLVCWRSQHPAVRSLCPWIAAGIASAALLSTALGAWHWRIARAVALDDVYAQVKLTLWFCWPAWPLALWTLWRWRRHLLKIHIAVPVGTVLVAFVASAAMGASDRALMLAVPGLAVLAAFALPTLQRSAGAAIDWFSVFFFSVAALACWVIYLSMQTGFPARPMINIQRLAPGFKTSFSSVALVAASLATVAWIWLVRWRTSRHRHPLWKSLVLPASGVALSWLLAMTLWLPALDYGRSPQPLVTLIGAHVTFGSCVRAPGMSRPNVAALEIFGRYQVRATGHEVADDVDCNILLVQARAPAKVSTPAGWTMVARISRPTERQDQTWIFRRQD